MTKNNKELAQQPIKEIRRNHKKYCINPKDGRKKGKEGKRTDETWRKITGRITDSNLTIQEPH